MGLLLAGPSLSGWMDNAGPTISHGQMEKDGGVGNIVDVLEAGETAGFCCPRQVGENMNNAKLLVSDSFNTSNNQKLAFWYHQWLQPRTNVPP